MRGAGTGWAPPAASSRGSAGGQGQCGYSFIRGYIARNHHTMDCPVPSAHLVGPAHLLAVRHWRRLELPRGELPELAAHPAHPELLRVRPELAGLLQGGSHNTSHHTSHIVPTFQ